MGYHDPNGITGISGQLAGAGSNTSGRIRIDDWSVAMKKEKEMFTHTIASRMDRLHTESAFGILAHANELERQGRSIIHCEIGQPDFRTPEHIIEAAYEAMKNGIAYLPEDRKAKSL